MANFLDLNAAISRRIFQYLSLPDIYNVISSSTFLQQNSLHHYGARFGVREICINSLESHITTSSLYDSYISGYGLILNFLKIFGGCVRVLTFSDQNDLPEKIIMTGWYISRYCESLTELNFCCLNSNIASGFSEPLASVVNVSFFQSHIRSEFILSRYFPNLRFLTFFDWNIIESPRNVVTTYPFLECLTLNENYHQLMSLLDTFVSLNNNLRVTFLPEFMYWIGSDLIFQSGESLVYASDNLTIM